MNKSQHCSMQVIEMSILRNSGVQIVMCYIPFEMAGFTSYTMQILWHGLILQLSVFLFRQYREGLISKKEGRTGAMETIKRWKKEELNNTYF